MGKKLPTLEGDEWVEAKDAIQAYARVLGKFRAVLSPAQKHYWHGSLRTYARGLVTPPIHTKWGAFEIRLDLIDHHVSLIGSDGRAGRLRLVGLPADKMATIFKSRLAEWEVEADVDITDFDDTRLNESAADAAGELWRLMIWADALLSKLKARQRAETSPVQMWPHHFDLSVLWLSGNRVRNEDPDKPEVSDEQINIGLSFGDENFPRPYFYLTVYPNPDGFSDTALPDFAHWHSDGWTGVRIPCDELAEKSNPARALNKLLKSLIASGERLLAERRGDFQEDSSQHEPEDQPAAGP